MTSIATSSSAWHSGHCPCRLSRQEIIYLDDKGHVALGAGGICRNPRRDETAGECGMVLADHLSDEGVTQTDERRRPKPPNSTTAITTGGSYFDNSFDLPYFGEYIGEMKLIEPVGQLIKYISYVRRQAIGSQLDASKNYYARYFSICQSSGYGKSRSIKEVAKQLYIVPICLRPEAVRNTEPVRSPVIANYIQGLQENDWPALLNALAVTLWRWKDEGKIPANTQEWYSTMIKSTESVKTFWSEVISLRADDCSEVVKNRTNCDFLSNFVLVFDEASPLLEKVSLDSEPSFVHCCRALSSLPPNIPFVTIFIDTNSSVSNFAPQNVYHSSNRVQGGLQLFAPFIFYPLDVFRAIQAAGKVPEYLDMYRQTYALGRDTEYQVKVLFNPFLPALYSRAMFSTWVVNEATKMQSTTDKRIWFETLESEVNNLAHSKLIPRGFDESTVSFACASCRFSLSTTSNKTQQQLVRHHMATLLAVDSKRENLLVEYPVEPILSLVAANYMRTSDENWMKVLHAIRNEIRAGSLECNGMKGEIGELAACIILTRCFDALWNLNEDLIDSTDGSPEIKRLRADRSSSSSSSDTFIPRAPSATSLKLVLFADVLQMLLFEAGVKEKLKAIDDEARFGLVGFTRFVQVERTMNVEFLRALFIRGVAAVAKKGERAIDIYIPMAIPVKGSQLDTSDPRTYLMSSVIIQVKNVKAGRSNQYLVEEMKQSDLANELTKSSTPHLYGIMHLGKPRPDDASSLLCIEPRSKDVNSTERTVERFGKSCFVSYFNDNVSCITEEMRKLLDFFLSGSHTRRLMTASRQELYGRDEASGEAMIDDNIESYFRPLVLGASSLI